MGPPEPVPMQSATLAEAVGPASCAPDSMRDEPTNPLDPPTEEKMRWVGV